MECPQILVSFLICTRSKEYQTDSQAGSNSGVGRAHGSKREAKMPFLELVCQDSVPYMSHSQMLGKVEYGLPAKI